MASGLKVIQSLEEDTHEPRFGQNSTDRGQPTQLHDVLQRKANKWHTTIALLAYSIAPRHEISGQTLEHPVE